jgi:hypothetical protein
MSVVRHGEGKEEEESLPVDQYTQMIGHACFLGGRPRRFNVTAILVEQSLFL